MPQLVLFNRCWSIGSDDFVFPATVDSIIRIVWLILVVCFYAGYGNDLDATCKAGIHLHIYFIGLLVFLLVTIFLEVAIVHVSRRGTISDSLSRRQLPRLLYARLIVALPEIAWNAYGTVGAFRISRNCHPSVVNLARGTVIAGWIVLVIAILTILVLFNLYTGKNKGRAKSRVRSFKRGSRRPLNREKQWEKRCKCMFMCAGGEDNTSVFSILAELSADYFKGVDLVPSDVIAGLILLSHKQERKRQQLTIFAVDETDAKRPTSDAVDAPDVICECTRMPESWMTLDMMSHYLKFAIASYGWPFYLTLTNRALGLCSLCTACKCCYCRDDQGSVYMDNCCLCNTAAFKKTTGLDHDDIVYACLKNGVYEIPFYVVIDREKKAVVIAIRGTLSLQDVITDLVIERCDLNITGIPCGCAHNGILQSAIYIQKTLEEKRILEDAFSRSEGTDLVVTGHSLGAGCAAMLAILLKPKYPSVRCFSFSPPGELVSPDVCEYAEDIICAVVLGDDIITRQGMLMMDDLKIQILKAIRETRLPKYKILSSGCWRMCCGRAGLVEEDIEYASKDSRESLGTSGAKGAQDHIDGPTPGPNGEPTAVNATGAKRKKVLANRCSLEMSLTECMAHSQRIQCKYQPLHIPGHIVHIEQSHNSVDEDYLASWKRKDKFSEIIVSPDMLAHHFPDALLDAIDSLIDRKCNIETDNYTEIRDDTEETLDTRIRF